MSTKAVRLRASTKRPWGQPGASPRDVVSTWLSATRAFDQIPTSKRDAWLDQQTEALGLLLASIGTMTTPLDRTLSGAIVRALEASEDPYRRALLARNVDALLESMASLDANGVGRVLASPASENVLLHLLEEAPVVTGEAAQDPLSAARLRGIRMREEIARAEGGTWTAEQAAGHLGITRQAVDKRRRANRLLAFPVGQHRYAYPVWQFDTDGVLPGFEEVLAAFTIPGIWTRASFYLAENSYLDGARPLDELRRGNVDAVCRAAAMLGEQGAA
jgi:hypothetical protein